MSAAALLEPPATDAAEVAERLGATAAQVADLSRFQALLADWNQRLNLVSPGSLAEFWPRHVWDSAQLLDLAPEARVWVDIGAGAGFPGLVLAILLKDRSQTRVHLVESLAKKCRFLAAVAEALDLPAEVHNARAEDLSIAADVVTARAVAPLERLLGYARPYLSRGAIGLFLKGRSADDEIAAARQRWRFDVTAIPSRSDPAGRILKVERLDRIR
jgi:16S rRNA (guanine527-N7)-methyltransferase